jgi:TfoX/Sxy family transcriptional regulator of competence genes
MALVTTYDDLAEEFAAAKAGVERARMFGSEGLRVGGKFFATFSKGRFVVKLSRERVDELVASGQGERFDPGSGRQMKEWVVLEPKDEQSAHAFLQEALAFVQPTAV